MSQNSNFAELGGKTHFFQKIQNIVKSERFDGYFRNRIPNVLEHWSLNEKLCSSMRQLERQQPFFQLDWSLNPNPCINYNENNINERTKFGGCLLCMKCRSGIEIQSKILILIQILILNRISIFTKTLRSDTKLSGNLKKICRTKLNFMSIINIWNITIEKSITKWYPDPDPDRNSSESENWLKLIDWKLFKSIVMHSLG